MPRRRSHEAHHPSSAPDVIDAPLNKDIVACNVFDTMPDKYKLNFVDFWGGLVRLV
jgi:hypothetical protein